MEIGIIASWIILSIIFSISGRNRRIGFFRALIICLIFSPIIGLIVILLSEKKSEILMKLKIAYEAGSISEKEYNRQVRKIVPNKEDKKNALIGYIVIFIILIIIFLGIKFLT